MHVLFCSHAFTKEIYRYILRNLMSKHSKASACQLVELGESRSSIIHRLGELSRRAYLNNSWWPFAFGMRVDTLIWHARLPVSLVDEMFLLPSTIQPLWENTCRTGPNMHVYEVERQSLLVEPQEIPSEESSRYRRIVKVIICRPKKQSHCSWGISWED